MLNSIKGYTNPCIICTPFTKELLLIQIIPYFRTFFNYIQPSFYNHFYLVTGRKRTYHLTSFLWALILQRIFTIPTDTLLITSLKFSKEFRDFCGFTKVPITSKFTRFKQDFLLCLQSFFYSLVDVTKPICQATYVQQ